MRSKRTNVEIVSCLSSCLLMAGCGMSSTGNAVTPSAGRAWVSHLPGHAGLQYCINLHPAVLAPAGSRYVDVHSLSAYVTSDTPEPALEAIKGRYPGWDSPGTTVYQQAFTNSNTVWVEIDHNFTASGIDCIEIYGKHLKPSEYASFKNRMLVGYSYFHRGHGWTNVKLFKATSGPYLSAYAPLHRPKH